MTAADPAGAPAGPADARGPASPDPDRRGRTLQVPPWLASGLDRAAVVLHAVHGSRGLLAGALGLLLFSLVEPTLPHADRTALTLPLLALLVAGLATLPREGVATQQRARALRGDPHAATRMARRTLWLVALLMLLSPRVFLAAYGVPHLNPLTGIILPDTQRYLSLLFLFLLLLLAVLYLRSSRRYAPHILSRRPRDLARHDRSHQERDTLLWMIVGLALLWGWLLRPFWHPFSLFQWPPALDSLRQGPAGVGSLAFSLTIPLMMFLSLVAHLSLLRDIARDDSWHEDRALAVWATVHAALALTVIILHAYDLLWIAQYRSAVRF